MEDFTISFDMDDFHILSSMSEDDVVIRAVKDYTESVVVIIPRNMYYSIVEGWLDRKLEYFKSTEGGFAGVGCICLKELEKLEDNMYLNEVIDDDDGEGYEIEKQEVEVYLSFDFDIDMEHG